MTFIGGSESMHRALEMTAAHWALHGQLPSNEEFQRMLDSNGRQTHVDPIQSQASTSAAVCPFEPQVHAAEKVGSFFADMGRFPTDEELDILMSA
jgi:hypothetical protein